MGNQYKRQWVSGVLQFYESLVGHKSYGGWHIKGVEAKDLRGQVCGILRHAKLLQDNLTKEQRKALKELRQIDELILLADKGNATVLMTREDYDTKMRGMIETATYRQLGKDPTVTQENRISCKLNEFREM